jgi:hypothetical protein
MEFCNERGWIAKSKNRFGQAIVEIIAQELRLSVRGDIPGADGKHNDGWKSLRLKAEKDGIL